MANSIDVNKLVGDVSALNKQIAETSNLLTQLINKQGTLNRELGGAKGLKQAQDSLNKSKKAGNEIEKLSNSLTVQKNKAVAAQSTALRKQTLETIKQKEALKEQNKALRDQARADLGLKKRTSLFQGMTKSIIAGGAALFSMGALLKGLKALVTTVFLGTQDNIDFFNQKLENVKGQFAVLTDSVSNFGQTVVESFKNSESVASKFSESFAKTNPIILAIKYNLEALKKLFPETAAAMKQNGEDAEKLQIMMDALNEKEIEYIGTKALLQKEMRLSRLEAKKAGDDDAKALMFIDKAIAAEKNLMALEMEFAVERSRIANERLELSISTRQDRKEAAILSAKVIELEVASIKKLTTLETERLSLQRRLNRQVVETEATIVDGLDKINAKTVENVGVVEDSNKELTITYEETGKRQKEIAQDVADYEIEQAKRVKEQRQMLLQASADFTQETGNILFDLAQANTQRELDTLGSAYEAKIAAAEGNNELQIQLANELEVEQNKLKRKQAQSERNQALFNIAINTAQNIVEAFPIVPLMAFAGILGGLQTAAVLSQPLPGFFTGTESAPEGLAWVAEKGRELIESNGQFRLAEGKQITNLQGGEKIYNNRDTEQMLNAAIYKDIAVNGNEGMESRMDTMIGKLDTLKQVNVNLDADGFNMFTQKGNSITHYLNRKGRK